MPPADRRVEHVLDAVDDDGASDSRTFRMPLMRSRSGPRKVISVSIQVAKASQASGSSMVMQKAVI